MILNEAGMFTELKGQPRNTKLAIWVKELGMSMEVSWQ